MRFAIIADRIFDGQELRDFGEAVVVNGSSIEAMVPRDEILHSHEHALEQIFHHPGGTLLPGLINSHCHLVMPGDGTAVEEALDTTEEVLRDRALGNALDSLRAGVTTLVDLGARNEVAFEVRRLIRSGLHEGPELILAGRPITSIRGHCWPMNAEVADQDALITEIRSLAQSGADIVKVMATGGGTRGTDPRAPQFSKDMLEMAVAEASSQGMPTYAHANYTPTIEECIESGFNVIVHGVFSNSGGITDIDERVVERAVALDTVWNPTLQVARGRLRTQRKRGLLTEDEIHSATHNYHLQADQMRGLYHQGIRFVAGSDEGWSYCEFGSFPEELVALREAGIPTINVLRSASSEPARVLSLSDRGRVKPGLRADLIVCQGNPLEDMLALKDLVQVVVGGSVKTA